MDTSATPCDVSIRSTGDHTLSHWEHFSHRADVGVRGHGPSLGCAFEQAALAMTAVIVEPDRVADRLAVEIECEAPDRELLLTDWLNALVYEMGARRMLFGRFNVNLEGNRLRATAWGEPIEPARHRPRVEIKGATYTALRVTQDASGEWTAQCVVDV